VQSGRLSATVLFFLANGTAQPFQAYGLFKSCGRAIEAEKQLLQIHSNALERKALEIKNEASA
jgi:hypothetical protein